MRATARLIAAAAALVLAGACSALPSPTAAVPLDYLPALTGDYFVVQSRAVGRPYHIYVRYPENYRADAARRYPTVYLLDGDSLFPILAASHLFLHYDDKLPEAIVVGIAYGSFAPPINQRHVDFAAPGPNAPEPAGAPAFHRFLKTELLPEVDRRYRTDPERRILFGQSRGGAFVLYSAQADPDLFWGRIASNPSFDPRLTSLLDPAAVARRNDLSVVVASGTHDRPGGRAAAQAWVNHWSRPALAPWAVKRIDIANGTHAADSPDAYRAAMRWLFRIAPGEMGP